MTSLSEIIRSKYRVIKGQTTHHSSFRITGLGDGHLSYLAEITILEILGNYKFLTVNIMLFQAEIKELKVWYSHLKFDGQTSVLFKRMPAIQVNTS